ncbi:ATP-dependent helicase [Candidatus Bathyarchaeota archaeon]|nr:ATP-dependent helicase [Candidatus Bathyarchaeota archaeon]
MDKSSKEYRVYGAPGCGKTSWIEKTAGACAKKYMGDQVSICSLTNAAVQEVASRHIDIPKENLTTLHARCKRALSAGDPAESHAKEFMEENKKWRIGLGGNVLSRELSLYERSQILRQQMIPESNWSSPVREFSKAWKQWCTDTGRMDFTGWLETSLKVRPLPPQQVVFVDEAQDHTPLQLAVINSWKARTIVLVGDADQSIYEWSGVIPDAFSSNKISEENERILEQSYRVPREVHRVATKFIRRVKNREERPYHPRDEEGEVKKIGYSLDDTKFSSNLPKGLLEKEDETYMIISSCAYMLNPLVDTLMRLRIPFHNPYRKGNHKWNPLEKPFACMNAFMVKDRMWTGDEASEWAGLIETKAGFKSRKKKKFLRMCKELGSLPVKPEDIRNHFTEEYEKRVMKRDLNVIREAVNGQPWRYALDVYSNDKNTPRLIIGTIHSVKGGESDNVILFPDLSSAGVREYLGRGADGIHRLFYVGMTRARESLHLCSRSRSSGAVNWN